MDTKNTLLKLVLDAQSDCEDCLCELFFLIHEAVQRCDIGLINWYVTNDMPDSDVLLFILLNDVELSVNFNEMVIVEAVNHISNLPKAPYH
ncbi:conserved hypothetical protein [Vibrio chagasii]|nr:conserved hypothetical protein [Vibrio chagasii]CAH7160673.1 conserved hypothetical protein [Vibrio chagasii]CAH7249076.1 conserved hypothetical protein [Vibrio chagasii]